MKTYLRGSELDYSVRREVLARFCNRMTVENIARYPYLKSMMDGYRMPIITDAQWLAHTQFAVTKTGKLDKREKHCMTLFSEIPEGKAVLHSNAA